MEYKFDTDVGKKIYTVWLASKENKPFIEEDVITEINIQNDITCVAGNKRFVFRNIGDNVFGIYDIYFNYIVTTNEKEAIKVLQKEELDYENFYLTEYERF